MFVLIQLQGQFRRMVELNSPWDCGSVKFPALLCRHGGKPAGQREDSDLSSRCLQLNEYIEHFKDIAVGCAQALEEALCAESGPDTVIGKKRGGLERS